MKAGGEKPPVDKEYTAAELALETLRMVRLHLRRLPYTLVGKVEVISRRDVFGVIDAMALGVEQMVGKVNGTPPPPPDEAE